MECKKEMSLGQVKKAVEKERRWLKENNAVSAVTDGPVEDMQGVPLLANTDDGCPPTATTTNQKERAEGVPAEPRRQAE